MQIAPDFAGALDPIMRVEWRHAETLDANDYNPNMVHTPELRLLERSLVKTGWVQPILINTDGIIIDGFHRARLALDSKVLMQRYGGLVPCAVLPVDRATAMLLTIRMNRAKGSHVAFRMSNIVRELIDKQGLDPTQIAQEIGANRDEIDVLYQEDIFKARDIKNYKYSKAWYPAEEPR